MFVIFSISKSALGLSLESVGSTFSFTYPAAEKAIKTIADPSTIDVVYEMASKSIVESGDVAGSVIDAIYETLPDVVLKDGASYTFLIASAAIVTALVAVKYYLESKLQESEGVYQSKDFSEKIKPEDIYLGKELPKEFRKHFIEEGFPYDEFAEKLRKAFEERGVSRKDYLMEMLRIYYGYLTDEEFEAFMVYRGYLSEEELLRVVREIARRLYAGEDDANEIDVYGLQPEFRRILGTLNRINEELDDNELSFLHENSNQHATLPHGVNNLSRTAGDQANTSDDQDQSESNVQEGQDGQDGNNDLKDCFKKIDLKMPLFANDIMPEIYGYLEDSDVCKHMSASKDFYRVLSKEAIWRNLLKRKFPDVSAQLFTRKPRAEKSDAESFIVHGMLPESKHLSCSRDIYRRLVKGMKYVRIGGKRIKKLAMLKDITFSKEDKESRVVPFDLKIAFVYEGALKCNNEELQEYLWENYREKRSIFKEIKTWMPSQFCQTNESFYNCREKIIRDIASAKNYKDSEKLLHKWQDKFEVKKTSLKEFCIETAQSGSVEELDYLLGRWFAQDPDIKFFKEMLHSLFAYDTCDIVDICSEDDGDELREVFKYLLSEKFDLKFDLKFNKEIFKLAVDCGDSKLLDYLLSERLSLNVEEGDIDYMLQTGSTEIIIYAASKYNKKLDNHGMGVVLDSLENYGYCDVPGYLIGLRRAIKKLIDSKLPVNYDLVREIYKFIGTYECCWQPAVCDCQNYHDGEAGFIIGMVLLNKPEITLSVLAMYKHDLIKMQKFFKGGVERERLRCLEFLINMGDDFVDNFYNDKELLVKDMIRIGDLEGVKSVVWKYKKDISSQESFLRLALEKNRVGIASFLVGEYNGLHSKVSVDDLKKAIEKNRKDSVRFIIDDCKIKPDDEMITRAINEHNLRLIESLLIEDEQRRLNENLLPEIAIIDGGYFHRKPHYIVSSKICKFLKRQGYKLDKKILYKLIDAYKEKPKLKGSRIHGGCLQALFDSFRLDHFNQDDFNKMVKLFHPINDNSVLGYDRFCLDDIKLIKFLSEEYEDEIKITPCFGYQDLLTAIKYGDRSLIEFVVNLKNHRGIPVESILRLLCRKFVHLIRGGFHYEFLQENPWIIEYLLENYSFGIHPDEIDKMNKIKPRSGYQRLLKKFLIGLISSRAPLMNSKKLGEKGGDSQNPNPR